FSQVWTAIKRHLPFDNSCRCDETIDNGIGISWSVEIPAGASVTRSHITQVSLGSQALLVSLRADQASVVAGAGNGYTITISNHTPHQTLLNSISDSLPAGFAYVPGSSNGATSTDPVIAGQDLTWAGPLVMEPQETVSLHFGVTAASASGVYRNRATADAGNWTVAESGLTAPVAVATGQ
ncbi:MAG: hypothetical protein ABI451_12545, partial [Dokdonella sp.]